MAVKLLEIDGADELDLPWLNEWKGAKKSDGTSFVVQKVVVRPKGLMVFTSAFKVFLWKSFKAHNQILEHIGGCIEPMQPKESVSIVLVGSTKYGYVPGFDDEVLGNWTEEGLNYTFNESLSVPSETPSLDLQGSGMVDSSPKNGRRAS